MSLLNRFKKQGGFIQLLQLIESTEPSKQKSLLHLVGQEDPGWAHLVRLKSLTADRILNWPNEVLSKILSHLSSPVIAVLYNNGSESQRTKILLCLPQRIVREVQELATNIPSGTSEVTTAQLKLVQTSRDLNNSGQIDFLKFDPSLHVEHKLVA